MPLGWDGGVGTTVAEEVSPLGDRAGPDVAGWLRRRMSDAADWPAWRLVQKKGDVSVSVVLPAHDEQDTVGEIVATIRSDLMDRIPLVDEIVVVDSRSTDDTPGVAARAGARVVSQDAILPDLPRLSGKGDALWKSLAVTSGDLVVFVDADLREFSSTYVSGLLGPLLCDSSILYVKGCYDRRLDGPGDGRTAQGAMWEGGRVTELVARPLINLHWPELAGFVQPLGGEYAARRAVLEHVPFVTGYGVEFGLLVDLVQLVGLDGLAQVDLGERRHTHQSTAELGRMATQILHTAWTRLWRRGMVTEEAAPSGNLLQFTRDTSGYVARAWDVSVGERPPMDRVNRRVNLA